MKTARSKRCLIVLVIILLFLFLSLGVPSDNIGSLSTHGYNIPRISKNGRSTDVIRILIAAFLIFFIQGGLILIEIGLARAKDAGHIVVKNLSCFGISSITFLLIGYGIMFGASSLGLFGRSGFLLNSIRLSHGINNWACVNLILQVVFAGTAATIVSRAMAERTKLIGYVFYSLIISGLIYPVAGHWIWGGGWLSRLGMVDFAGSSVIHSMGAWVSLAFIIVLGPRIGRYQKDGIPDVISSPLQGYNIPLATLGVIIICLGWFGFNIGSLHSCSNPVMALIIINTLLSGASGSLFIMFYTWLKAGKPDVWLTLNGALAGLVTSTASSVFVCPFSSVIIGSTGGIIMYIFIKLLDRFKLDDPVGAISIHGANGIWGTLSVALFAQPGFSQNSLGVPIKGLLFGGDIRFLAVQSIGVLAVFFWSFGAALAVFRLIGKKICLRISNEEEIYKRKIHKEEIRETDYNKDKLDSFLSFEDVQRMQETISSQQKRLRELSIFHEISQSMHSLNLDEILQLILKGVTQSIGFDRARLYLINERENVLECKIAVGIDQEKIRTVTFPLDKEKSLTARVVLEKKAYIIHDADNDPKVNKQIKDLFNLKSFVVVPLQGKERIMGAISADYIYSGKTITKEKVDSLITFAGQAGMALEIAQLYQELKQFNEELEERVRKATDDLKKTQEQLIQSSRLSALGQLSAGVAHEIRNPLTSISILIHSLKEKLPPKAIKKADIDVIENEIERINQIIKQFLDFARPSKPKIGKADINDIIEDTLILIRHDLLENDIKVKKRLALLPFALADRDQIKQAFLNIILNAIQAMPGGGELVISTGLTDNYIKISFMDEGNGIPESIREKLFDPFFTTKEEGIGLGLSITRRVVDDHKGKIDVESTKGKGTTFSILLPYDANKSFPFKKDKKQ